MSMPKPHAVPRTSARRRKISRRSRKPPAGTSAHIAVHTVIGSAAGATAGAPIANRSHVVSKLRPPQLAAWPLLISGALRLNRPSVSVSLWRRLSACHLHGHSAPRANISAVVCREAAFPILNSPTITRAVFGMVENWAIRPQMLNDIARVRIRNKVQPPEAASVGGLRFLKLNCRRWPLFFRTSRFLSRKFFYWSNKHHRRSTCVCRELSRRGSSTELLRAAPMRLRR